MSSVIRYISDPHFHHENMAIRRGFENAEQMNNHIIQEWNKVVGKRDITWILGDITMEKANYSILDKLNGIKKVVLGNHDKPQHVTQLLKHVNQVCSCFKKGGIIFTHIPIHESELNRFRYNIHGHTHENNILDSNHDKAWKEKDKRYINVCMEVLNYQPKTIEELLHV